MDLERYLIALTAMSFVACQASGAQMVQPSPSEIPKTQSRLMGPGPSVLRAVVAPRLSPNTSQYRRHRELEIFGDDGGNGVKGAILGALILGTAGAVVGSQLCEEGENCTGTTIGFGLIGATIGAVVGAFVGSAVGSDESEGVDSPAPELPAFVPQSER